MERYLDTIKPIVSAEQLEKTECLVAELLEDRGLGERLQEALCDRRENMANWAYEWWLNDMYMNIKLPLPIHSNPGMVFPPRKFRKPEDISKFVSVMIHGILKHKDILSKKLLMTERATSREKGQPLCMEQFYRLLNSYRMPCYPRDKIYEVKFHRHFPPCSEHVIVICKKHMFLVTVKDKDGMLSHSEIDTQILNVMKEASELPPNKLPIGILTTLPRDRWSKIYAELITDKVNEENINLIQDSMMILCLDEPLSNSFNSDLTVQGKGHVVGDRDETNMAHQMMHGGGSQFNSANRWFDKTLQLIVCCDGTWGLCYEHSPSEGLTVVCLLEEVLKSANTLCFKVSSPVNAMSQQQTCKKIPFNPNAFNEPPCPVRLEWNCTENLSDFLNEAECLIDRSVEDFDFFVYRYKKYGKEFMKKSKVSPDVFCQLVLQLAYYRLNGTLTATYESASTRRFQLGRVDCIRSATCEALEWAEAMVQDGEAEEKCELFYKAAKKQTEIMVQNILGEGIDIHLLGLKEMAKDLSEPIPEIFKDESFELANHFALSTSQIPTSTDSFMGYGPVVPDGYGASYNPHQDSIVFCLSAFKSSGNTSVRKFAESLEQSLNDLKKILPDDKCD